MTLASTREFARVDADRVVERLDWAIASLDDVIDPLRRHSRNSLRPRDAAPHALWQAEQSVAGYARRFAEHSHIGEALLPSLLPSPLPQIHGAQVASFYRPAGASEIGGDFYDVMGEDRDWVLLLGDVCGKGLGAATLALLARQTARVAALRSRDPSLILSLLNDMLLDHNPLDAFCTAVCVHAHVNGSGASLRVAIGGHPAPYVLRRDGAVTEVPTEGPLVGAWADSAFPATTIDLLPGDLLLMHTDGLTDARRGKEVFGDERAEAVVRTATGMPPERALRHMIATLETSGFVQHDDVAMLALQLETGEPPPAR